MTFHYMNSSSSTLVNTHTDINMKRVQRPTHGFGGVVFGAIFCPV